MAAEKALAIQGERSYRCAFEGCGRLYTTQHHLKVSLDILTLLFAAHVNMSSFRCSFTSCKKKKRSFKIFCLVLFICWYIFGALPQHQDGVLCQERHLAVKTSDYNNLALKRPFWFFFFFNLYISSHKKPKQIRKVI